MNQKERMLAGLPYKAWLDGLEEERFECKKKIFEFNNTPPENNAHAQNILKKLFKKREKICILNHHFIVIMAQILR